MRLALVAVHQNVPGEHRVQESGNMPALPLNSDRRHGRIYLAYSRFCGVNNIA